MTYKLFNYNNLELKGFPTEVTITKELLSSIYQQLKDSIGNNNIFFIPSAQYQDEWYKFFPDRDDINKKWHEHYIKSKTNENIELPSLIGCGSHHDDYIIGTLTNIESIEDDVCAQIEIHQKFKSLSLSRHNIYVGLNSDFTRFKPYKLPITYNESFEIESFKIKGLFFRDDSSDYLHDYFLYNYYQTRGLSMYVYLPGRSYY